MLLRTIGARYSWGTRCCHLMNVIMPKVLLSASFFIHWVRSRTFSLSSPSSPFRVESCGGDEDFISLENGWQLLKMIIMRKDSEVTSNWINSTTLSLSFIRSSDWTNQFEVKIDWDVSMLIAICKFQYFCNF